MGNGKISLANNFVIWAAISENLSGERWTSLKTHKIEKNFPGYGKFWTVVHPIIIIYFVYLFFKRR